MLFLVRDGSLLIVLFIISTYDVLLFQGTTSQKLYFMIFERGPRAFVDATYQTLTRVGSNGWPVQYILHSVSDMVSTKIAALTSMQHCLAAFLAEVCYFCIIHCVHYDKEVLIL
jgi:hypothetical protein